MSFHGEVGDEPWATASAPSAPGRGAFNFFGEPQAPNDKGTLTPSSATGGATTPRWTGAADDRDDWEKDTPTCKICDAAFSATRRRHHCRSCGRCVCARCSPASLELEGSRGKQRVCAQCVSIVQASGQIRDRLRRLGTELNAIHDFKDEGLAADAAPGRSLEEALLYCEQALVPLKVVHGRATSAMLGVGERIAALAPACWFPPSDSQGHSMDEAVSFCLDALQDAEDHHAAAAKDVELLNAELLKERAELFKERTKRQTLDKRLIRVLDNVQALDAQAAESVQRLAERATARSSPGSSLIGGSSARRSSSAGPATRSSGLSFGGQLPAPLVAAPTGDRASLRETGEFPENTKRCEECSSKFGRGPMASWPHHCRNCSRCVCAACSPGSVTLQGWRGLQRVCTRCTVVVGDARELQERLSVVGQQLRDLSDRLEAADEPATLKEAVAACESAVTSVKDRHAWARETLLSVGSKLQEMGGEPEETKPASSCSLADIVGLCRAAIDEAQARMSGTEAAREDAEEIAAIHAEQAQEATDAAEVAQLRAERAEANFKEARGELEEFRASLQAPRGRTSSRNWAWPSARAASESKKAEAAGSETTTPAANDLMQDDDRESLSSVATAPATPPNLPKAGGGKSPRSERPSRRRALLQKLTPTAAQAPPAVDGEEPRRRSLPMFTRSRTSA